MTTLSIAGRIAYDDEITVAQALRIISYLNQTEGENSAQLFETDPTAPGENIERAQRDSNRPVSSPREALDVSGARTNPERIVALGQYVLLDGGETFKAEDVKGQFRRAREAIPANLSRDLSTAVQSGWIAEDEEGEYYVTNNVQGIFDGDFEFPKAANGARTRRSTKTTKPRSKPEKPETFSRIDEFSTQMTGFSGYAKMTTYRDKMLWVLQWSKGEGIDGLTNRDITWLTDHLGYGIPNKQISAVFNQAQKSGYVNRSTLEHTIRITDDGTSYLQSIEQNQR